MKRVLITLALLSGLSGQVRAQEILPEGGVLNERGDPVRTLHVMGTGEVTVFPDKITAMIGTSARNEDRKIAAEENRKLAEAVRAALIEAGIEESGLKTNMTRLEPVFEYVENTAPRVVAYDASSNVEFTTTDPVIAGAAIDASVDAGATNISGPALEVSDTREAESEARAAAMRDALKKAQTLSEAGNFGITQIISVSEGSYVPPPIALRSKMMMVEGMSSASDQGATQIDTGEQIVRVEVSATFEIDEVRSSVTGHHQFSNDY